ncbi:hypothetical protein NM208_g6862 [Fusarium decemcellulare]|uniref:Uncharacterized protein n=1 Tax=Fusarium decemcellulare TaxID=57161 RepID=A0ACC1SBL6_9HYPO|nr:hypothetical protein NM208_g6862 [Fusarium decemcellulare]
MEVFATASSLAQGISSQARATSGLIFAQPLALLFGISLISFILHIVVNRSAWKKLFDKDEAILKWPSYLFKRDSKRQAPAVSYVAVFPPSPRDAIMPRNDSSAVAVQRVLGSSSPTVQALKGSQLPTTRKQDLNKDGQYTPTGFSTAEIRALGRFPDYSVLSGVPHPKPCPDFDIKRAVFRPFRPFRWAYHQTMSLQKFEPDFWVELENNYFDMLKRRKDLYKQQGSNILNYGPGSELACRELMEMRDEANGMYYLRAGFICSSIGWTFGTHFNRQLRAIHTEVNDYEEKMAKSMDRYFSKMPTDKPIQRGAWFVEDWEPLFVTPDEYKANGGTRHKGEKVGIDQCYLRVDWQTLRRLPLSGTVVFNFKAIFTPMTELRDEPYVPSVMYKQITEGKALLTESKVHEHIRPAVLNALQEWKHEQVEEGMIVPDWKEETLLESPFYPGWEERWRQKIGFPI